MTGLLLAAVSFLAFLQGTHAAYCKKYTSGFYSSSHYTYIYCSYGCCGTTSSRYCCSDSSYNTFYTTTSSYLSIGSIIGAVIGGIIGLCVLITIIVVIIKACTKSGGHGRVVQPVQHPPRNTNVFVMSTGTYSTVPPTQPAMPPPPYTGQSGPYPPPEPVYPLPGQANGQPGAPGTYAALCLKYTYNYYSSFYDSTYTYCSYGCCGTSYSRYCCSDSSYNTFYTTTSSSWSIGAIIGVVIGGIFGLCVLITIILSVIKACTKSGSHGRVVQPVQHPTHNPNVFVMSTGTHSTEPQTQPAMPPPAYAGQSGPYPPPAPVYPFPGQSSGQPGKTG